MTARNALVIVPALFLGGCGLAHAPVLDPHGTIALTERNLLFIAAGLMLVVIVPVWVLTFWFTWHYRASNVNARYMPEWSYSAGIDAVVWLVPALIVCCIAYLVWVYTHRLDPYKPIAAAAAPLEVDVVAEDWKWLFIYPEQKIATVNELVFPSERPLSLDLTSDTVMNSFYVAGLGGQIFVMAGMRTKLNLKADGPAEFLGRNMQYSGAGFAGFPEQDFAVRAVTPSEFEAWVATAKHSPDILDASALAQIEKPSGKVPVHYYSSVEPPDLFARIIAKYAGPSIQHAEMKRTQHAHGSAFAAPASSGER
ncbi:MAG TPA: ubiquinol oxidase subunit II [Bradyrhizobium sp.]|nr:ubiquinol oxidase subunit II [Bradyrhizobium sp.]